jgi:signal transduction histidine kinase
MHFASLEFTNSSANVYAYMLQGIDKNWIYSGQNNEARYANLPPGSYLFKVKGANSDGVWNNNPQEIQITIIPPWWQTTWFRIVAVLLMLSLLVFIIHSYITARIRGKLQELEKQKAVNEERLRISRDMHDELGTGLTKIALLSEVTTRSLKQKDGQNSLQEITATSRQLTQKMGEIIWTLNPVNDTLDNLAAYIKEQLYDLSEAAELEFKSSFPENIPPIKISNRQRQQILLVTKEGFNNILKHARATKVVFGLVIKDSITFTLEDNGRGIEKAPIIDSSNGKRNGLSNMAWRMNQVNGTFSITRTDRAGTTLRYSIPIPK